MKLELPCIIEKVEGIEPLKNGFRQFVILHVPAVHDELKNKVRYDQYFRVEIYSTKQTDSRFCDSSQVGAKTKAILYLNGERWVNSSTQAFNYNNKLKLAEWQPI